MTTACIEEHITRTSTFVEFRQRAGKEIRVVQIYLDLPTARMRSFIERGRALSPLMLSESEIKDYFTRAREESR